MGAIATMNRLVDTMQDLAPGSTLLGGAFDAGVGSGGLRRARPDAGAETISGTRPTDMKEDSPSASSPPEVHVSPFGGTGGAVVNGPGTAWPSAGVGTANVPVVAPSKSPRPVTFCPSGEVQRYVDWRHRPGRPFGLYADWRVLIRIDAWDWDRGCPRGAVCDRPDFSGRWSAPCTPARSQSPPRRPSRPPTRSSPARLRDNRRAHAMAQVNPPMA